MNKQSVTIKDSEIRESQLVVAGLISGSFNKSQGSTVPDEIKTKLAELTRLVETVCKSLPAEVAKDVAKDLDILVGEAVKKEPRRKWYELSAEGLKEAAQKVGEIGKPILGLLKEISGFLGF